jgi:poly(3-hydroxybutyrate) depolymerase
VRRRLRLGLATIALALASPAHAAGPISTAGDHDRSLGPRTFVVHVPPAVATAGPLPVLVAFHGGGGTATGFKAYAGLDRVADREDFVAAATPSPRARTTSASRSRCCAISGVICRSTPRACTSPDIPTAA